MSVWELIRQNDFLWCIGIVLLYMYLNKRKGPKNVPIAETQVKENKEPTDEDAYDWFEKYLYLSNGRQIPAPHLVYYIVMLGLEDNLPITFGKIDDAYYNRFEEVAELRKNKDVVMDVAGLKAARDFLTDRYNFTGYLN